MGIQADTHQVSLGKNIIKIKIKIHRAFWRNSHTLADISFSSFYISFLVLTLP